MDLEKLQIYFQKFIDKEFQNVKTKKKAIEYDFSHNMNELIDYLDKGQEKGLPYYKSNRLTRITNGLKNGSLTYLVFSTGVGKTSFITEKCLMSLFENKQKGIIFINEEGIRQIQTRLLATIANRKLHLPIPRKDLNKGNLKPEIKLALTNAINFTKDFNSSHLKIISLNQFSRMDEIIQTVEKFRTDGYEKFFFDTFKPEISQTTDRWLAFSNAAQKIYDTIKPEALNCSFFSSVQLKIGKESRYLDLNCIGKSLEISEVASVILMGRKVYDDEYDKQPHAIDAYNYEPMPDGKFKKIAFTLYKDKKYFIIFIAKNREGSTEEQVIYEYNLDFNFWEEVAYARVENIFQKY